MHKMTIQRAFVIALAISMTSADDADASRALHVVKRLSGRLGKNSVSNARAECKNLILSALIVSTNEQKTNPELLLIQAEVRKLFEQ